MGTTSGKWDIKNYVPVISLPFEPKRAWSIPGSRQSLGGVGGNSVTYSYWFQFCLSCFWSTLSLLTAHIKCIFFNPTNILFLNATLCQQLWNTLITKFYHHVYKKKKKKKIYRLFQWIKNLFHNYHVLWQCRVEGQMEEGVKVAHEDFHFTNVTEYSLHVTEWIYTCS